jgi:glycosyltransferase involved in cell wall biosynthesis
MEKIKEKFNPLVSIIIPVYNGSNYMREAIDSALAQTYENIEVIVVNDGSTDNTDEIARSYGDKIRYFKKKNGGVATALNLAIEKSKGEYISWLSHDDVYYINKVEEQILCLKKIDDKNTILYSDWDLIDAEGIMINSIDHRKSHTIDKLNISLYPVFRGLIHGCTLLLPKSLFLEVGNFDVELKTTQDYDMWFKILRRTFIRHIGKRLIKSRVHDQQGSVVDPNHLREANVLWVNMMENINENEIFTFEKSTYSFYRNIAIHLKKSPLIGAYGYARKKMKETGGLMSVILPT